MTPGTQAVLERGARDLRSFADRNALRQIRGVLDALTPDTRRLAEKILTGLGFSEAQIDAHLTQWANDKYEVMTYSERESNGWRYWSDEALGARL